LAYVKHKYRTTKLPLCSLLLIPYIVMNTVVCLYGTADPIIDGIWHTLAINYY